MQNSQEMLEKEAQRKWMKKLDLKIKWIRKKIREMASGRRKNPKTKAREIASTKNKLFLASES